jgi:hypothetical protein
VAVFAVTAAELRRLRLASVPLASAAERTPLVAHTQEPAHMNDSVARGAAHI